MSLIRGMLSPVRCTSCHIVYDLATVEVLERRSDCSVWLCPGHNGRVDDRGDSGWKARRDYVRVTEADLEQRVDIHGRPVRWSR